MKTKLESFIQANKEAFDVQEPSAQLWQQIDQQIPNAPKPGNSFFTLKSSSFLLGTIAVITSLGIWLNHSPNAVAEKIKIAYTEPASQEVTADVFPLETVSENLKEKKSEKVRPPVLSTLPLREMNALPAFSMVSATYSAPSFMPLLPRDALKNSLFQKEQTSSLLADSTFSGIKDLDLSSTFFDVSIVPASDDRLSVTVEMGEEERLLLEKNGFHMVYKLEDSKLFASTKMDSKKCKYSCKGPKNAKLIVHLPLHTDLKVFVTTGNIVLDQFQSEKAILQSHAGDIHMNNSKGNFRVKTTLGNIEIENTVGEISIFSTSGDITLLSVKGNCNIQSTLGNQSLSDIQGNLKSKSTSGDIHVSNLESKDTIQLEASMGNLTLEHIHGSVNGKIYSGDLKIDDLVGDLRFFSTLGNQKMQRVTGSVSTSSTSGDIVFKHIKGDLAVKSNLGNIEIDDFAGSAKLEVSSGDVIGRAMSVQDYLKVKTQLGNTSLELTNPHLSLSKYLKTERGEITVIKEDKKEKMTKEWVEESGNIKVEVTSNSGDVSLRMN